MGELPVDERLGDDPDDGAAGGQGAIRDGAHEAHATAAIDERDGPSGKQGTERTRRVEVDRVGAGERPAEHGHGTQHAGGRGRGGVRALHGRGW